MYTCKKCGLAIIVLNGTIIRACKCKEDKRKRTRLEKVKMFFGLKVEDISEDAGVVGNMKATAKGAGGLRV